MLIGHRGACGWRPEHSPGAYRLAFAQGVDAVEPDIVVSRDGVLVVRHECEIGSTTDIAQRPEFASYRTTKTIDGETLTGWFAEDLTWEQLSQLRCIERLPHIRTANTAYDGIEPLLRLSDLLQLTAAESAKHGTEFKLVIELKHVSYLASQGYDLPRLLCDELREGGWHLTPERVIIECFELTALQALKRMGAPYQLIFLLEHEGHPADDASHSYTWYRSDAGLAYLRHKVAGISVDKQTLLQSQQPATTTGAVSPVKAAPHQAALANLAKTHGLQLYTWTLRPENEFLEPLNRSSEPAAAFGNWQQEWRDVLATGVDAVFVDHPALFREMLSEAI